MTHPAGKGHWCTESHMHLYPSSFAFARLHWHPAPRPTPKETPVPDASSHLRSLLTDMVRRSPDMAVEALVRQTEIVDVLKAQVAERDAKLERLRHGGDAAWPAGYQLTTARQLEQLPMGTVIRSRREVAYSRFARDWGITGDSLHVRSEGIPLPATVLYLPESE